MLRPLVLNEGIYPKLFLWNLEGQWTEKISPESRPYCPEVPRIGKPNQFGWMVTPFNWMKSNLKAIEAGGHGLAVLASNVLYEKTLVNGETAALFADVADLQQHLKMWVENPDAARQLGRRTRQWVAENHLAAHQVAQREQWYRNLASRRAELNRALWERVPSLRPEGVD